MDKTNYAGIDYGLQQSNIDRKTGIRYGVISQNTVGEAWYNDAEPDYGKPTCPKCGNEVLDSRDEKVREDYDSHKDYYCEKCDVSYWCEACFSDEPIGWSYNDEGYELTDCLDNDIIILKSPYFTYAQFCSPCVPGACNLNSPLEEFLSQNRCFCLGHEWFKDGKAPYQFFSVETGEEILPKSK